MLDECVPGHSRIRGDHYWSIAHPDGKRVFPAFPTGSHGARRPEAEIGHVRALVRLFEIPAECVSKHCQGVVKKKT
jgi:hypothetical protein